MSQIDYTLPPLTNDELTAYAHHLVNICEPGRRQPCYVQRASVPGMLLFATSSIEGEALATIQRSYRVVGIFCDMKRPILEMLLQPLSIDEKPI